MTTLSPVRMIVAERLIPIVLALTALGLFSTQGVLNLLILIGVPHGILAYYYQWRAGKIGIPYVIAFTLTACLIFYVATQRFDILLAITIIHFSVHFCFDDAHLVRVHFRHQSGEFMRRCLTAGRTLEMLPIVLLFSGNICASALRNSVITYYSAACIPIILAIYLFLILRGRHQPDWLSYYFHACSMGLLALTLWPTPLDMMKVFGFFALVHYLMFYVHFHNRTREDAREFKIYWGATILVNVLSTALFAAFLAKWIQSPILDYVYNPIFFYSWTFMHTIFTTRFDDWRGTVRLSPPTPAIAPAGAA